MKFKSITLMVACLIFIITGEPQDPLILRLIISAASGAAVSTLYCALTQDMRASTAIAVPLAFILGAATLSDPDPAIVQLLLAFLVCPIIAGIAIKQELDK